MVSSRKISVSLETGAWIGGAWIVRAEYTNDAGEAETETTRLTAITEEDARRELWRLYQVPWSYAEAGGLRILSDPEKGEAIVGRFLVFGWATHEAAGGMNDLMHSAATFDEALEYVIKHRGGYSNWQIFDTVPGEQWSLEFSTKWPGE